VEAADKGQVDENGQPPLQPARRLTTGISRDPAPRIRTKAAALLLALLSTSSSMVVE